MSAALLGFLCGCFWFGVSVIAQLVTFRFDPEVGRSKVLVRSTVAAVAAAAISVFILIPRQSGMLLSEIYASMTVGCLFVLFGPFFYTVHTSLSVQSLILLDGKGGRANLEELRARFASPQLVEARLCSMVESGYLTQAGEQYFLTPRARRVVWVFTLAKLLWRLGAGG